MAIVIRCPECSAKLRVGDDLVGKSVQCPRCKNTFTAVVESTPGGSVRAKEPPPPPEDVDVFGGTDVGTPKSSSRSKPPAKSDDVFAGTDADAEERPSRRSRRPADEDEDVEDRPSRRSRRPRDEDEDDRPSRRRGREKPGQVTAAGIMMLIGGIIGCIMFLSLGVGSTGICCLWPGTYYSLVAGIMAIIGGSRLLGENAHRGKAPTGVAVMMIVNIINLDTVGMVLGIISLVMLNQPEAKRYFRG